jgi:hypothetical protein
MIEENVNMKLKIEQVLLDTGNSENRAAKMDVDDLLKYVTFEWYPPLFFDPAPGCSLRSMTLACISHSPLVCMYLQCSIIYVIIYRD